MKLIFKGKCTARQLSRHINTLIKDVQERADLKEEVDILLENAEINVVFKLGEEESYLTVPREINGEVANEMFVVAVPLDEKGKIKTKLDNEEESVVDEKTLAEANGIEYKYNEIESEYDTAKLEVLEILGDGEAKSVRYLIKNTDLELIRFYKNDKLVAEQVIDPSLRDEGDINE